MCRPSIVTIGRQAALWPLWAPMQRVRGKRSRRHLLHALEKECPTSERAENDGARAKSIDTFAHIVEALVMSQACPDDSPLADEILAVCRDKILGALAEQEGVPPHAAAHATQSDVA